MQQQIIRRALILPLLSLTLFALAACDITEIIDSAVEAAYDVEGVVLEQGTNDPVEGVTVEFVIQLIEDGNVLTEEVITGPDGTFSRQDILGTITITPSKDGWSFEPASVTATEDADDIVFLGTNEVETLGQIAYYYDGGLYVMNPDGSNPTQVAASGYWGGMSWSPDRQQIALDRQGDDYDVNIHIINLDGTGEQVVQTESLQVWTPSWSPDGTRVATRTIIIYTAPGGEVFFSNDVIQIHEVDTGNTVDFSTFYSLDPAWSPDGGRIAYASNQYAPFDDRYTYSDPTPDIFVQTVDGSGDPVRLTTEGARSPSWSPDGTQIAYHSGGTIYVMDDDGSNKTPLTSGVRPTWSLDGSRIAFRRDDHIWVMDADGSNETELREGGNPAWRD